MSVRGIRSIADNLYGRIPEVSAEGAGLFRMAFGALAVLLFLRAPIGSGDVPSPPEPLPEDTSWLMRTLGEMFLASPERADAVMPWICISGALFVAGVFTRLSFAAFTGGALAWGVVHSLRYGHHPISAFLVALLCLLPSRWGDAWSVDAWLRKSSIFAKVFGAPGRAESREYGYTVWVPGVVLGLALFAAAASKLYVGGLGWILNGTVKYHFLTDAASAPVDWGLRYGLVPGVAVALSFGAVAVEGLALPAAALGRWPVRAITAVAVAAMLTGFWLFQGVYWPAWWILLFSFAPWHWVSRDREAAGGHAPQHRSGRPEQEARDRDTQARRRPLHLRYVQGVVLVLAVGQQGIASVWRLEVPPMISAYDMYSTTYETPDAYPTNATGTYWLVATLANGTISSCPIGRGEAERFGSLGDPAALLGSVAGVLASCLAGEPTVRTLSVEHRRPNIDWNTGRYLGTMRVPVAGPVALVGIDGG